MATLEHIQTHSHRKRTVRTGDMCRPTSGTDEYIRLHSRKPQYTTSQSVHRNRSLETYASVLPQVILYVISTTCYAIFLTAPTYRVRVSRLRVKDVNLRTVVTRYDCIKLWLILLFALVFDEYYCSITWARTHVCYKSLLLFVMYAMRAILDIMCTYSSAIPLYFLFRVKTTPIDLQIVLPRLPTRLIYICMVMDWIPSHLPSFCQYLSCMHENYAIRLTHKSVLQVFAERLLLRFKCTLSLHQYYRKDEMYISICGNPLLITLFD